MSQPFSYFYLSVSGQIDFGEFMELDGLALKYAFVCGSDWSLASGAAEGAGQYSFKGTAASPSGQRRLVWNLPYEAEYRSMTPSGWPSLVLYCIEKGTDGADRIKAYGSGRVPTEAGMHTKKIRMFSNVEQSTFWEYFGFETLGAGLPELMSDPRAIANPEGRELARVMATGSVTVTMQVN